ncbi:MAG: TIGR02680 family protein [Actinomycetota bacterium]|nr:TIGR02680 family protein [Actinomycetota bacterium]
MTLIEHIGRARALPRPAPGRFRPLRAGILGVWEYDDQEFWFADGRLILRGQNTAGKSKALELLLPFVLDGETRPERLDPFGNRSKTMYWNLIDFDPDRERRAALGYCWLELGRVDDDGRERIVTALVGLRATRAAGRRVDTWFAVTPLRVGDELDLAPDGRPLTAERLREELDGRGRVHTSARDHRTALDAELFGLGPDRYEALIHLLLQLRRPKLSEKLDVTKLTDVLTDALPPLERGRLDLLAQAFARLDADAAELEALTASHAELGAFLAEYRAFAQLHVRLRADAVRAANTRFDKVTETARLERQERDDARSDLATIEERRTELDGTVEWVEGQLAGLDLSKVHALLEVERLAEHAEATAAQARRRAVDDAAAAERAAGDLAAAERRAAAATEAADAEAGAASAGADAAGLGEVHRNHADQLLADPAAAGAALDASAQRRLDLLRDLRRAAAAAAEARRRVERAEERHREADAVHDERRAEARVAADDADAQAAGFADSVDRWADGLDDDLLALTAPAASDGGSLGADVLDAVLADGASGDAARAAARAHLAPVHEHVRSASSDLAGERARRSDRRVDLAERLARVEAEADDAPPASAGRPEVRAADGAPLWACVDFADDLDDAQRAGLEAALGAAGVLDALVTAQGELLSADTLDTVISGATAVVDGRRATQGLGRWLRRAPEAPMPAAAIDAALASVGAGEGPGPCWVAPDGRWANGSLRGRWTQPEARYVGAATRAAARARRIAELTDRIAEVDARLAELEVRAAALADLDARADLAVERFPTTTVLRDAIGAARRAEQAATDAAEALAAAAQLLEQVRAESAALLEALAEATRRAGCSPDDVDDAVEAVNDYRLRVSRAVGALREAIAARADAADAATRAEAARDRAEESDIDAARAEGDARRARGEADELRRTVGTDVDEVLARQRDLERELTAANDERRELDARRDGARDRLTRAETRLQGTEAERDTREQERAVALEAQARLASTELAVLAVGAVDPERDLTQVTAGLAFARAAFDRLRDVTVDQRAQDTTTNRLHGAFTSLRSQLAADFDPHLDTSDGVSLCVARLGGRVVGAVELERALAEQVERRRATLSDEERDVIERHLLTEVGTHLGERVHAAWSLVDRMNTQLSTHPTRSGVTLRLSWEASPDAGPAAVEALKLLRRDINLLTAAERATLATFLAERVRAGRDDAEGADVVERLAAALDYRRWHRFVVQRRTSGGSGGERFTARTQAFGSGGEQAKLAHLPLFAAMAGYYASARPTAPHLVVLDEAFAGIDDDQRGDCMAMLVELDLDPVLANYSEWGCYPEVPQVAVYHLERTPGVPGVAALRFVWDGTALSEDDPFLDARTGSTRDAGSWVATT